MYYIIKKSLSDPNAKNGYSGIRDIGIGLK